MQSRLIKCDSRVYICGHPNKISRLMVSSHCLIREQFSKRHLEASRLACEIEYILMTRLLLIC